MRFVQAISSGFSNYVSFSGRARRSAYWYWTLFATLVTGVAFSIDAVFGTLSTNIIVFIATLGLCLPGLAVTIRRLHDTNHSGWWVLVTFGALPGVLLLIFWFCMKGTEGPNRFGPDPIVSS